jgi:predicted esterase
MNDLRRCAACLLLAGLPSLAAAQQQGKEAIVMFKDGFYVRGMVAEKREFIVDAATGKSFSVPDGSGFIYVDDHARRIHFSPTQVQEVLPVKPGDVQSLMVLKRYDWYRRKDMILPGWDFESVSPWNDKWLRTIKVNTHLGSKYLELTQRILILTPEVMQASTLRYNWDLCYRTKELGPELCRTLVHKFFESKKEMREPDRLLQTAAFLMQAGWLEAAEKELADLLKDHPGEKGAVDLLKRVQEQRVGEFVDETERFAQRGQHLLVRDRLALFDKENLAQAASAKQRLAAQDLKTKYESSKEQLNEARKALEAMPPLVAADGRAFWAEACAALRSELNLDTLPRLETFASFAQQHLRDRKANVTPAQSTEEVLALAISGWLQGNQAAEPDPKMAQKLFQARQFLLEYLKRTSPVARNEALAAFSKQQNDLPIDVLARLIRLLPPAHAYEKIGPEVLKLNIEVPEAEPEPYLVQLPPDYNHQRDYPVLLLLHGARTNPEALLKQWQEQAAQQGFILAAPIWNEDPRARYQYTAREHAVVLNTLRDLRRRFQVDSDRVFLFGCEEGATMAFDVGLSHPDQFAGVLPMCGSVRFYPQAYWPNAQYLPFYIVEGDRNGGYPKLTRNLFKDWIRGHYASLYVEYKGRGSEWFAGEVPLMMNWMSRKKRHHPQREVGRYHTSGAVGSGEEFKTMREGDNRFYWLSTEAIAKRCLNEDVRRWQNRVPAALQANLGVGNELDKKGANIWSQFNIRTSGVKQVSLWLEGGLIDFAKPVRIRVNGEQVGADHVIKPSLHTLLEELAVSGDRQRLMFARIDVRLK